MGKKPIIAGVVGIPLLLLLAALLVVAHQISPAITVHHVKSYRSGQVIAATFVVTNHTSDRYFLFPRLVEANDGSGWKTCFEFSVRPESELRPFGYNSLTLHMTDLPSGPRLRLSLLVVKELRGLKGFPGMLRLKFIDGVADIPNPFKKYEAIGSHAISITSDAFAEPDPINNRVRVK